MGSTVEELEAKVAALERLNATKEAELRLLVADAGGVAEAAGDDADLLAKLGALKVAEEIDGEVPVELLMAFFKQATEALDAEATREELEKLNEGVPVDESGHRERTLRTRTRLDEVYSAIWARFGVADKAAAKAVTGAGFRANSDELSESEQAELSELIDEFQEAEQRTVGEAVLGKEEFAERLAQRERFMQIQDDMMEALDSMDGDQAKLGEYLGTIQSEAMKIQAKLQKMSKEEAAKYVENPSPEDEEKMMKMQALQMLLGGGGGGGGHGHSHGGKPCHGHGEPDHGHSHEASHGHSHGGEPCHGHGAPAPAPPASSGHGHSHGGKPCHGHGH